MKYLEEEHPSVNTLNIMIKYAQNMHKKYELVGIVREPLLHTTGKNGFDFYHGYHFKVKDENNDQVYTLAKQEGITLAELGLVYNATANSKKTGLRGINCDLRKLKQVIPENIEEYLSENELQKIAFTISF